MSLPFESLDPATVNFSQATISRVFTLGEIDPALHISVIPWQERPPFTLAVLTIAQDNVRTAYDNRRLFSARWRQEHGNEHHRIHCRVKDSFDTITGDDYIDMEGNFVVVWEAQREITGRLVPGHVMLTYRWLTYGGAVAVRGASQVTSFPCHGRLDNPEFGTISDARNMCCTLPLHKLLVNKYRPIPITGMLSSFVPTSAYFGLDRKCLYPLHEFMNVLKSYPEWFDIEQEVFYPETTLEARGDDEDQPDDHWDKLLEERDDKIMMREIEWDGKWETLDVVSKKYRKIHIPSPGGQMPAHWIQDTFNLIAPDLGLNTDSEMTSNLIEIQCYSLNLEFIADQIPQRALSIKGTSYEECDCWTTTQRCAELNLDKAEYWMTRLPGNSIQRSTYKILEKQWSKIQSVFTDWQKGSVEIFTGAFGLKTRIDLGIIDDQDRFRLMVKILDNYHTINLECGFMLKHSVNHELPSEKEFRNTYQFSDEVLFSNFHTRSYEEYRVIMGRLHTVRRQH